MKAGDHVENLLDDATVGLRDDPELRLDVKAELASHISAATVEHRNVGLSEAESRSLALKSFGSAMDLAAEILAANRRRMKLRALTRLAVRALLVPAAMIMALWILGFGPNGNFLGCSRLLEVLIGQNFENPRWDDSQLTGKQLSAHDRLILHGGKVEIPYVENQKERERKCSEAKAASQRAIWESDTTNRVYYGNYITTLIADFHTDSDLNFIAEEIQRGEKLDPENARYNYLLAGLMLERSCTLEPKQEKSKEYRLIVKDRALLDKAMSELLLAQHKPYLKTYTYEMAGLRQKVMGAPQNMLQHIARIGLLAGVLLPDISRDRNLIRACVPYSELLISEGRSNDAPLYLEAWYPLCMKIFSGSSSLIENLAGFSIAEMGKQGIPVLETIGQPLRAAKMKHQVEVIRGPYLRFKDRIRINAASDGQVARHGGMLQQLLMTATGEGVVMADLMPGRYLEQVQMEQYALRGFTAVFALLIIGMGLASFRWRLVSGGTSAPLLLLPDVKRTVRILVLSVILPLFIFFIYTRYSGIAGREYSVSFMWPRFVSELGILISVILFLSFFLSLKNIRQRCSELGVSLPPEMGRGKAMLLALVPFGMIGWLLIGQKSHGFFKGTLARSLIPVFAAVIILVGAFGQPYLMNRERFLVQNDPILSTGQTGNYSNMEARLVERLKKEVQEAVANMDL